MYTDIFSTFDPATRSIHSISAPFFFALAIFPILLLKNTLWINPNQSSWLSFMSIDVIVDQSNRTSSSHIKGTGSILGPLFILLIIVNLTGLLPYAFSLSSHVLFSFSFGIPIWLMIILSALKFDSPSFLAHLLPAGSPTWLNPFLVLIETLRNLLRPITLSLRLAANIRAGHIILTLASTFLISSIITFNITSTATLMFICSFYSIFEIAICIIQAYIFCLLLSLYTDDHPLYCRKPKGKLISAQLTYTT